MEYNMNQCISALIAGFAVVVAVWYIIRRNRMSYFKYLGIPGPEPHLIYGNLKETLTKGMTQCHSDWIKRYGKVVGYYLGARRIVLVADTEVLKQIEIKKFHSFINRPPVVPSTLSAKTNLFRETLLFLEGNMWKEIRSAISPTFSTSKMKQMVPLVGGAVDIFMKKIEEKAKTGEAFDIYEMYQGVTTDVIGQTAFGIQVKAQTKADDPFVSNLKGVLSNIVAQKLISLSLCFPEFNVVFNFLRFIEESIRVILGTHPIFNLIHICREIMETRRKFPELRRTDLLQLMLDSTIDTGKLERLPYEALSSEENNKNYEIVADHKADQGKVRKMTNAEIEATAFGFLVAGYETTSAALAFTTHCLVNHLEVQEKIREEIKNVMNEDGQLGYNIMTKLPYLDQAFSESLRLYPPVFGFIMRESQKDFECNGIKIPKGADIQAPLWSLHHDPKYWSDPYGYDPERFSPENKKKIITGVYQPFGMGPRNCVGMRLAQMEVMMILARLLHSYRLVPCEKTEKGFLSLHLKLTSIIPKNGVHIKVVPVAN